MNCRYCEGKCIKKGQNKGKQKYRCKSCLKYQLENYSYHAMTVKDREIVNLLREGCGIRSMSRILHISPGTVITRIKRIAQSTERKFPLIRGKEYEADELFTYIGNKKNRVCIAYLFESNARKVCDFVVGYRNKSNLKKIIDTALLSHSTKITTDKLNIYKELIPEEIHCTKQRGINRIERNNLNLRTHLKRLNRRTICFSKSIAVLTAIIKIYFWY